MAKTFDTIRVSHVKHERPERVTEIDGVLLTAITGVDEWMIWSPTPITRDEALAQTGIPRIGDRESPWLIVTSRKPMRNPKEPNVWRIRVDWSDIRQLAVQDDSDWQRQGWLWEWSFSEEMEERFHTLDGWQLRNAVGDAYDSGVMVPTTGVILSGEMTSFGVEDIAKLVGLNRRINKADVRIDGYKWPARTLRCRIRRRSRPPEVESEDRREPPRKLGVDLIYKEDGHQTAVRNTGFRANFDREVPIVNEDGSEQVQTTSGGLVVTVTRTETRARRLTRDDLFAAGWLSEEPVDDGGETPEVAMPLTDDGYLAKPDDAPSFVTGVGTGHQFADEADFGFFAD